MFWLMGLLIQPILASVSPDGIKNLPIKINYKGEGHKYHLESIRDGLIHQQDMGWVPSVLNEIIKRQNKRLSFLENYVAKDQVEKMRTVAVKEKMDKEEIVHLKHEVNQLQEIANMIQHPGSSEHLISKRQTQMNRTVAPLSCSTSGNCVMLGRFCPYPDRPIDASDFVSFVVQKHVPYSNANKSTHQVKFEEVLLNLGGAFNMKENVFIAPKSGIYEFNFDGHKTGDPESLNISLRLNGKDAVNAWSDFMGYHPGYGDHDYRNLISMNSILKLKKGDRIDLFNKQGSLHNGTLGYAVQPTQFTGRLFLEEKADSDQRLSIYFNIQKNTSYCKIKSPVPFEIMNLDEGGAFDLKQQEFISPVSGIYEFIVKGFKTGKKEEMEISLRHNGNRVANAWVDFVSVHEVQSSFSIYSILKMEKGDKIDLFLVRGCLYDDSNHYTGFTGKLLMEYNNTDPNKSSVDAVFFNVQKKVPFSIANAVIPFEIVVLNIGWAFNSTENFFIAPRSGIYEFNAALVKDSPQRNLSIALRLNKRPVAYAWADFAASHFLYTPFSLHSILKVKKGDSIDLFHAGSQDSELYDDSRRFTQFTGKLLYGDDNMV